jgi:signal transduction histidine kinase/ligand-binding sensor domain-containing protein
VNSVLQGPNGYLWLGTGDGLARFDGTDVTVFDKSGTSGLESNEIWSLLQDREGGLWIATSGGGVSHLENGTFTAYSTGNGLSEDFVKALYEDSRGDIWMGTIGGGITRFDGSSFDHYTSEDGLPGNDVLSFEEDHQGTLWIGTENGVSRYRDGTFNSFRRLDNRAGQTVRALYEDQEDVLWIGTDKGLVQVTDDTLEVYTSEDGLCGDMVSALYGDETGALWIGTLDGGACRMYDGTFEAFTPEEGLTHSQVRSFYQDREGNLWIGTDGGGLNRLRDGKFTPLGTAEGLSNDVVATVIEDQKGVLWIGTDGGGLNRVEDNQVKHITTAEGLPSNYIYALESGGSEDLWLGMLHGGICRRTPTDLTCYQEKDGLPSSNVWALEQDQQGRLWIGTDRGLARFDAGEIRTFTRQDGLPNNLIMSIYEDQSGALWVGTYGGGLARLRDDEVVPFTAENGLPADVILALHEDTEGTLWVGTKGSGLCRYQGEDFKCITVEDGLHSDTIVQILSDDRGDLWLGSQRGISRVSMRTLNAFAAGRTDTIMATVYDETDGLRSREMNGGTQPAAWKARDGRLYFSSVRGLATINPAEMSRNKVPPPVRVESLRVDGRSLEPTSNMGFAPHTRDLQFQFTGLSLTAPDEVKFWYKLENYDREWQAAGNRRIASYTNLPPGRYDFRVKARNEDGVWSEKAAHVEFRLQPYFYETVWFIFLCVFSVGFVGATGYYFRMRQVRRRERELEKQVAEQTEELTHLNNHLEEEVHRQFSEKLEERRRYEKQLIAAKEEAEEMNRLKDAFLANMSHEVRTPLTAIIGYSEILHDIVVDAEVPSEAAEFAKTIEKAGKRLMETLTSVLDLARLESGTRELTTESFDLVDQTKERVELFRRQAREKGLVLALDVPAEEEMIVSLDRTAYVRILTNLVSNAIKFTEEGRVEVSVTREETDLELRVSDTGVGISDEFLPHLFDQFKQESAGIDRSHEGSGLGLAITKEMVELMGGEINVETQKGKGTTFIVGLPMTVEFSEETKVSAV